MKYGLMSYEIESASIKELFRKIRGYGCTQTEFSFRPYCPAEDGPDLGMGKIPATIPDEVIWETARQARLHEVEISMVCGFWNMISPDVQARDDGLLRLERLAQACNAIGCEIINLCTGSKSGYMWRPAAENDTVKAWIDICENMEKALRIAEHYSVYLGVEVEAANVINTAEKARKLMDTMQSPWLKIILDGANLFHAGECRYSNSTRILKNAFEVLEDDIIGVHGKDMLEGDGLTFTYCGNGIVDFQYMLSRLKSMGYDRGIILHGAHSEEEIAPAIANLQNLLDCNDM